MARRSKRSTRRSRRAQRRRRVTRRAARGGGSDGFENKRTVVVGSMPEIRGGYNSVDDVPIVRGVDDTPIEEVSAV